MFDKLYTTILSNYYYITILLFLLLPILFILLVVIIYNIKLYIKGSITIINKLPGPYGLPLIGTALYYNVDDLHIWSHKQSRNKYGYSNNWIHYVPAMPLLVCNNTDDISYILNKQHELFEKGEASERTLKWWCNNSLLLSDGQQWKKQRSIIQPLLSFNNLNNIQNTVHNQLHILINRYDNIAQSNNNVTDITILHSQYTLDVTASITFGIELNCLQNNDTTYNIASQHILKESWARTTRPFAFLGGQTKQSGLNAVNTLNNAIDKMIKQYNNHNYSNNNNSNKQTVLTELLHNDNTIHDIDYYRSQIRLLMIAGSDTTSFWITSVIHLLVQHQHIYNKLVNELDNNLSYITHKHNNSYKLPTLDDVNKLTYLQATLRETQRIQPSTPSIARKLKKGQLTLPSGTIINDDIVIAIIFYSIHRNVDIWGRDADQFKPERWIDTNNNTIKQQAHIDKSVSSNIAYIPFNSGSRSCVGQYLAKTECSIVIATLLRLYKFELYKQQNIKLTNAISMLYDGGLKMIVTKRDV